MKIFNNARPLAIDDKRITILLRSTGRSYWSNRKSDGKDDRFLELNAYFRCCCGRFSALIDRARHGETIVITDRGRPVARLVAALTEAAEDPEGRLATLERRGGIRLATAAPARVVVLKKFPKARKPSGVLDALLEERDASR